MKPIKLFLVAALLVILLFAICIVWIPNSTLSETSQVLIIIQALFVIGGVIIALINFNADHERRKKQATIEFYMAEP
jgi:hypothetical protein